MYSPVEALIRKAGEPPPTTAGDKHPSCKPCTGSFPQWIEDLKASESNMLLDPISFYLWYGKAQSDVQLELIDRQFDTLLAERIRSVSVAEILLIFSECRTVHSWRDTLRGSLLSLDWHIYTSRQPQWRNWRRCLSDKHLSAVYSTSAITSDRYAL